MVMKTITNMDIFGFEIVSSIREREQPGHMTQHRQVFTYIVAPV